MSNFTEISRFLASLGENTHTHTHIHIHELATVFPHDRDLYESLLNSHKARYFCFPQISLLPSLITYLAPGVFAFATFNPLLPECPTPFPLLSGPRLPFHLETHGGVLVGLCPMSSYPHLST